MVLEQTASRQLGFTGLESFFTKTASLEAKSTPSGKVFEAQFLFIGQAIQADLLKKFPSLCVIPKGEEIGATFQSGGDGKVKLITPAFVLFREKSDGKHKFWNLVLPAVVKHPKYDNEWTLGFKNTTNSNSSQEGFTYPKIGYSKKKLREATREDLDKFVEAWQKNYTKDNLIHTIND